MGGGLAVLPARARAAASFDGGPTTFNYTGSAQRPGTGDALGARPVKRSGHWGRYMARIR
jgi:hypothetical protein